MTVLTVRITSRSGGFPWASVRMPCPQRGSWPAKRSETLCESGKKTSIAFINPEILTWETVDGCRKERFVAFYTAITPREGVFFVDFILSYGDSKSVSIVLDMERAVPP